MYIEQSDENKITKNKDEILIKRYCFFEKRKQGKQMLM